MSQLVEKITWEIPRRFVDQRFDVVLLAYLEERYPQPSLSRGMMARLIKEGQATLNGTLARPHHPVSLRDKVEVLAKSLSLDPAPPVLQPRSGIEIPVLYEDEHLIALNKPAGLQTHPVRQQARDTVAHFISSRYPALSGIGGDPLRPGIVHRLDRETSGALLIAKTEESFEEFKKLFKARAIEKTYIALVYGNMSVLEGRVDKPLLQRSGALKRVVLESSAAPREAREALTLYRVIARYRDFDLLSVNPQTGRTHQIRAHVASVGNPLVGDKLYAWKPMRRGERFFSDRQMLHASRIKFELFSKTYVFIAPVPSDFRALLRSIDETKKAGYDDEALRSLLAA